MTDQGRKRAALSSDCAPALRAGGSDGYSGFFWTMASDSPLASRHPPMPSPGPDDWR